MDLLTYKQAAQLVDIYNQNQGNVKETAAALKRPYAQCLDVLEWLWSFDFKRDPTGAMSPVRQLLPPLTKGRWANYLYAHNVNPLVAAVLLGWTVHEVLHSCGGPTQWRRTSGRKAVMHVKPKTARGADAEADEDEDDAAFFRDPTPHELAEIEERKNAVQAAWTPNQRAAAWVAKGAPVEVQKWTDNRR
jgi:hypothetical protein